MALKAFGYVGAEAADLLALDLRHAVALGVGPAQVVLAERLLEQPDHADLVHLLGVDRKFLVDVLEHHHRLLAGREHERGLERAPVAQLVRVVARRGGGHVDRAARGEHEQLLALAEPAGEGDVDLDLAVGALLDRRDEILLQLDERPVGEVMAPAQLVLRLRSSVARAEAQGTAEDGKQQRKLAVHRSSSSGISLRPAPVSTSAIFGIHFTNTECSIYLSLS